MSSSRRSDVAWGLAVAATCAAAPAAAQEARAGFGVEVAVDPAPQELEYLQLEVYLNDHSTGYVASFTRRANGRFSSPAAELRIIGVQSVSADAAGEVMLDRVPGLFHRYDDARQTMWLTLGPTAQRPTIIDAGGGDRDARRVAAVRPPPGATLDYTLFASASDTPAGPRFGGVSGAVGLRMFGAFGLIESDAIGVTGHGLRITRLSTTYSYEDPERLVTVRAGDVVNGGLAWTRPIRMAGVQLQRSFGIRPDLVTLPIPRLSGSAAAPSTLDLYIDRVRALSADLPAGPYAIAHPPIVQGAGQATVVMRDALGRETISSTPFYASPQLLAPGLTDFSAELGFARRGFATRSNDYDGRPIGSASLRRGLSDRFTVQGHVEAGAGVAQAGAGGVLNLRDAALLSVAGSTSHAGGRTGGLIDVAFETRRSDLVILLRTMRAIGPYQDLASRTASFGPVQAGDRRVFGAPREVDQFSLSLPMRRLDASLGLSLVNSRAATGDRYRLANLSATASVGRLAMIASAVADLGRGGSFGLFLGASLPLGDRTSASAGVNVSQGRRSVYAEASRQGAYEPGSWGWSVRVADGRDRIAHAIVRHSTRWATLEATGLHAGGRFSGTMQAEGAVALVGGGLHAARRLDQSFAVVDAAAPGVRVFRENRLVGTTGRSGMLLVPDLAAFESSAITIDPASLPVDARIDTTHADVAAFTRVPAMVRFAIATTSDAALVRIVDDAGQPLPVGSIVARAGQPDDVVGYDGAAYLGMLEPRNLLLVTDPDGRQCRATFDFAPRRGEQVRLIATCRPVPGAPA